MPMTDTDIRAILAEPIPWTGDLEDDCTARWRGFGAHAECMDEYDPDDPGSSNAWYCCVWEQMPGAKVGADNREVFHSSDADICPLTGPAARQLCELVMRLEVMRKAVGG